MREGDRQCLELARRQFGVIGRFQALEHIDASAIKRRVASGAWLPRHPQTYVLSGVPQTRLQDIMAAYVWAASNEPTRALTCTSHSTAAWLHGLLDDDGNIDITCPRSLASRENIRIHRVSLEPVDRLSCVGQIPVTTIARTLFDLGADRSEDVVESALECALRKGLIGLPRLRWQVERCAGNGKRGARTLRRLLEERSKEYVPTESELELRFHRLLSREHLPLPMRQKVHRDNGKAIARVDFAYPEHNLVIEVYGWQHHSGRAAWERDNSRTNAIVLTGQRVLVFTWRDVMRRPEKVIGEVRRALGIDRLFR
jgi:very-short-patch-repair endonuclease